MDKKEKRKQMKQLLQSFQGEGRIQAETEIYEKVFAHPFWQGAQVIAITMSMPMEINTKPMIERAWEEGKKVAVPLVDTKTKQMIFYEMTDFSQLIRGTMGILEPSKACQPLRLDENALCIVPGLAFSKDGYRVGFGGGFYDRFLASFSGKTIALAFYFQFNQDFWIESYDIPVQTVITHTYHA